MSAGTRKPFGFNWTTLVTVCVGIVTIAILFILIVVLPPYLIDSRGLTPDQRLSQASNLRSTLVTALAGVAVAIGTYVTARTFGHQRNVLHETMRQNRAIETNTREQIEIQRRAQLAEQKKEAAGTGGGGSSSG